MMSRVEADIEAIKELRGVLITFAARQTDAMEAAESAINSTLAMLEEAQQRWRSQIIRQAASLLASLPNSGLAVEQGYGALLEVREHLTRIMEGAQSSLGIEIMFWAEAVQRCLPAVSVMRQGYGLIEATRNLINIEESRQRVEEAAVKYRGAKQHFADVLTNDLPRATSFLADRIAALEAYYTTQLLVAATALAGTDVPGMMGGVIGAVRRRQGELSRVMGSVGEQIATQVLSGKFGLQEVPFDQPKRGFDRVFRAPGMPLIVMESKVSSSGQLHLEQIRAGEQASPEWIATEAARMADRGSAQWSPANERIARLVDKLGPSNVPAVAVVVNPETGATDVYWRQGESDWQPVGSGTSSS